MTTTGCLFSRSCTPSHTTGKPSCTPFDLLELNGDDYRREPLEKRKAKLAKLLAKADPGIRLNEHFDGGDPEVIFRHACKLGLEGIVSKRRDFPYRSGRCKAWVKVKNPSSPAMMRIEDGTF